MTRTMNTLAGPVGNLTVPSMPSSAGNSGGAPGWAFDFIPTIGGTATLAYSATHLRNGGNALHVVANATDTQAYARWNTGATSPAGMFQTSATTVYAWCDVWFTALPSSSQAVMAILNTAGGVMATLRVLSTGFVSCRDSGGTNGATTTNASTGKVVVGQWCRVECKVTFSATVGQTEARVFPTASFGTPGDSVTSAATLNTGTVMYGAVVGTVNATAAVDYYVANAGFSDVGYPVVYQTCLSRWAGGTTATSFNVVARVLNTAWAWLQVSTTSNLLTAPVYSAPVAPDANGLVALTISGLTPGTTYYYGLVLDSTIDTPANGTIRTFPTAGSPASFSFAAASCAKTFSNHAVFDAIRTRVGSAPAGARTAAFFQHLGDLNYRDIVANTPALFQRAWDETMSCPRQQALYSSLSTNYTWSDHDSGGGSNNDGTAVAHAAAQSVYRLRVPGYTLPASDGAGIYYSYVIGRVRFIVTDGRSYMSPIAQTDDALKTKLGSAQKDWFKSEMLQPEPVKVWFHEDAWANGTTYVGDDTWSAYNTERAELVSFFTANHTKVVIVHGDLHILGADDGTHSPGGVPVFVCAPLDQTTYAGNGTYSAGIYPVPQSGSVASQLYGWFDLIDNGSTITLAFTGYDSGGTARITQSTVFSTPTAGGKIWTSSSWVHVPAKIWNGSAWVSIPGKIWNGAAWVSPA